MTMRSRFLRHWYVNDMFNDAIAWMDNEMRSGNDLRLDGTLESMWIVSACHVQEEKTENNTRTNTYAQVHRMRINCVGTVLRQATTNTLDQSA